MTSLLDPTVLLTFLVALTAGFVLGRFSVRGRGDPSDVSRLRRQAQLQAATSAPTPARSPVDLPPEAVRHLQNGAVISAIKALKDAHPDLSLKQAKDAVDDYARRNGLA